VIGIYRQKLKDCKRIIVKVGTSTLTYDTGRLNLSRIDKLARILSDMQNSGKDVILVTSGAIAVGMTKLGLKERPTDVKGKQAAAAVGQGTLMNIYEKFFSGYNHVIAQILLTRPVTETDKLRLNARNTFDTLLLHNVIPIVNENDTISIEEIEYNFGENDTLASIVAEIVEGDLLIMLSDIDGLYTKDPKKCPDAELIYEVDNIDSEILKTAGGAGSARGTGGMITKIEAARRCIEAGINMVIANGEDPYIIEDIMNGKNAGTFFLAKQ
jgi:glutamate 5-kinase